MGAIQAAGMCRHRDTSCPCSRGSAGGLRDPASEGGHGAGDNPGRRALPSHQQARSTGHSGRRSRGRRRHPRPTAQSCDGTPSLSSHLAWHGSLTSCAPSPAQQSRGIPPAQQSSPSRGGGHPFTVRLGCCFSTLGGDGTVAEVKNGHRPPTAEVSPRRLLPLRAARIGRCRCCSVPALSLARRHPLPAAGGAAACRRVLSPTAIHPQHHGVRRRAGAFPCLPPPTPSWGGTACRHLPVPAASHP